MIKGKSKFDFDCFYGDCRNLMCFNKQRYSKEEAIELWYKEQAFPPYIAYLIEDGFVRYRYGVDDDGENRSTWWCEFEDYGNKSVPVWCVRQPEVWEGTE